MRVMQKTFITVQIRIKNYVFVRLTMHQKVFSFVLPLNN